MLILIVPLIALCFSFIQTAEHQIPHYLYLVASSNELRECRAQRGLFIEDEMRPYMQFEKSKEKAIKHLAESNARFNKQFILLRILTSKVKGKGKFEYNKADQEINLGSEKIHYLLASGIIPLKAITQIK
jgi:hypothetical protein